MSGQLRKRTISSGPALVSHGPQHSGAPNRTQDTGCPDLMTRWSSTPAAASPPATIQKDPELLRNALVKGFQLVYEIKVHSLIGKCLYCNIT